MPPDAGSTLSDNADMLPDSGSTPSDKPGTLSDSGSTLSDSKERTFDTMETTSEQKALRAEQDQTIQNDIAQYVQDLLAARSDSALAVKIEELGFNSVILDEGDGYTSAAQTAYNKRQQAIGAEDAAFTTLTHDDAQARAMRTHYRAVVRIAFPKNPAARIALGAIGRVPKDRQKFVTQARAGYQAGAEPPYAEEMTRRGYGPDKLSEAVATLDAVDASAAAHAVARHTATDATTERNTAYDQLTEWGVPFRAAVRLARKK
jgi:hypothetical protein